MICPACKQDVVDGKHLEARVKGPAKCGACGESVERRPVSDVVLIVTGPFIVLIPVFMAGGGSIQDLIELLGLGLLLLCAVAWGVRKLPLARSDAISLEVEKAFWVGLIIVFFVWVAVETL